MSNRVSPEPVPLDEEILQPRYQAQQLDEEIEHFISQQNPGNSQNSPPEPFHPEKTDDLDESGNSRNPSPDAFLPKERDEPEADDDQSTQVQNVDGSDNRTTTVIDIDPPEEPSPTEIRHRRNENSDYFEESSLDNGLNVDAVSDTSNEIDTSRPTYTPAPPAFLPPLEEAPKSSVHSEGGTSVHRRAKMSGSRPNSAMKEQGVIGATDAQQESGCCAIILTVLSYILVILFFPLSLCATIKVVQEYERAVIFRLGRLLPGGAKGPGIFFVMPCIEEYTKVDLRTVSFDVPPQEVLTRDSVTVSVDAVVYYRISSPTVSVANVENAANSTQLLAQTTLRNVLGTQNLAEILSNREHISEQMQNALDDATDKWGIKVERVEIKDVRLPTQLQRAMAAEAEAARDARAKVIAAEGEQKASVALKEAADIIGNSPAALQLRYLQTLNSISAEKNSTIIFPLPIDVMQGLIKK